MAPTGAVIRRLCDPRAKFHRIAESFGINHRKVPAQISLAFGPFDLPHLMERRYRDIDQSAIHCAGPPGTKTDCESGSECVGWPRICVAGGLRELAEAV